MMPLAVRPFDLSRLRQAFGGRVQSDAPLDRYTAARLGGRADALLEVETHHELAEAVRLAWLAECPFVVLGGGSNVLVSDQGVRGLVILNRARQVRFDEQADPPTVWAESGANFGLLARQAAQRGLAGLEWAAGIPGTVGGAVVGNAGAHGGDMAGNLLMAEILHPGETGNMEEIQAQIWPVERLAYTYRSSVLKRSAPQRAVVLTALLKLERGDPQKTQARIDEYTAYRKRTQPPGASMGSMFKNPPGDYAGRLIEAAGLKGVRVGGAQISPLHANFFINQGDATAADVYELIRLAQDKVVSEFGVHLELEIELLGEW
jgi:UDP-N-acetylmuramate dehydrogenase